MIKREFWEKVAGVWARQEVIEIPEILDIPDIPDDMLSLDDVGDMDDFLKDLLSSDADMDLDLEDFLSD